MNLAEKSPDSDDIFMEDVVSCNYPNRPDDLEDLGLHDFIANYDSHSKDSQGRHIYRKATKPRLVILFFDSGFQSLTVVLLIFVPSKINLPCFENRRQPRCLQMCRSCKCGMRCLSCKAAGYVEGARKSQCHHRCKIFVAPEEHSDNKSDDEPQLLGEAKVQDVQAMNDSSDDDITLDEKVQC